MLTPIEGFSYREQPGAEQQHFNHFYFRSSFRKLYPVRLIVIRIINTKDID